MTLKRVASAPLNAHYKNPDKLSQELNVRATVNPVRRSGGQYNHVKKSIKVTDIVKVTGVCKDTCLTSPVVLELTWSAPEGVTSDDYKTILDNAITALGGVSGIFIPNVDSVG